MEDKLLLCWIFVGVGAFIIAISIPLILRKVGPNRWYGMRTRKTLGNEKIWFAANRLMGINLAVAGVATVSIAGSLLLTDVDRFSFTMVAMYVGGGFAISISIAIIHGFFVVERLR